MSRSATASSSSAASTASQARSPTWPRPSAAATPRLRSPSCAPATTTSGGSTSTSPSRDARGALRPVREAAVAAGRRIVEAARAGDAAAAIAALGSFRLLCAHRRGPYGVATWNGVIESWLANELDRFAEDAWYVGRPLLVTQNDYGLRLFNGDTGVIVARDDGRKSAVFERQGELVEISPTRLDAVDTVHALTIHKSQGSQVDAVAVLLPDPSSRILTRELLYTAVTRARTSMIVCGTEAAIRAALGASRRARVRSGPPALARHNARQRFAYGRARRPIEPPRHPCRESDGDRKVTGSGVVTKASVGGGTPTLVLR